MRHGAKQAERGSGGLLTMARKIVREEAALRIDQHILLGCTPRLSVACIG
jgi:hypothetical protein